MLKLKVGDEVKLTHRSKSHNQGEAVRPVFRSVVAESHANNYQEHREARCMSVIDAGQQPKSVYATSESFRRPLWWLASHSIVF